MDTAIPGNRLGGLEERAGISPDLVALESRLLSWRESLVVEIRGSYPPLQLDSSALAKVIESGQALVDTFDPQPAPTQLARAASSLLAVLEPAIPAAQPIMAWLSAEGATEQRTEDLARWFAASWKGDGRRLQDMSVDIGTDPDVLVWTGRQLARPFFHRLGELLAPHPAFASRIAQRAGCPSCGGAPRMGRYEQEEGRRHLWCDLCDLEWVFPRVTCPFCMNGDHTKLGFLSIEGQEQYRIDVCEVCHGYLRAIDERKTPEGSPVDFLIEDVGTLHLCVLAEKQDYRQGTVTGDAGDTPTSAG